MAIATSAISAESRGTLHAIAAAAVALAAWSWPAAVDSVAVEAVAVDQVCSMKHVSYPILVSEVVFLYFYHS